MLCFVLINSIILNLLIIIYMFRSCFRMLAVIPVSDLLNIVFIHLVTCDAYIYLGNFVVVRTMTTTESPGYYNPVEKCGKHPQTEAKH